MKKFLKLIFLGITSLIVLTGCGKHIYKLNEEAVYKTNKGKYSIKITNVEEKMSNWHDETDKKVVLITYEVSNIDIDSEIEKDNFNFVTYDKQGNSLSLYLKDTTTEVSPVTKGNSVTKTVAYYFNSEDKYINIKYYDNFLEKEPNLEFELEW